MKQNKYKSGNNSTAVYAIFPLHMICSAYHKMEFSTSSTYFCSLQTPEKSDDSQFKVKNERKGKKKKAHKHSWVFSLGII